jgi:hypothetical protein
MLRKKTVEKGTLDLVKRLMQDEKFKAFNLVGGTALALKIGHRKSIDIDLFSTQSFNASDIAHHVATVYNAVSVNAITNGVFCFINDVKIDILAHQYTLVEELEILDGVRLVSLLDISAMKLNAIYNNGTRLKDFVDINALLEYFPLQQMLQACEKKYPDISIAMVKKALLHHQDIQFLEPIEYIGREIKWDEIAERLQKAFHNPLLTFSQSTEQARKLMEKLRKKEQNKNRGHRL